jgi:hypothetical protein
MLLETNTGVVNCYLGVFKTVITIETGDITLGAQDTAPRHEETNVESCDGEEIVCVTDMGTVAAATTATVTAPTATTVTAPTVTATTATRPPNTRETSRA